VLEVDVVLVDVEVLLAMVVLTEVVGEDDVEAADVVVGTVGIDVVVDIVIGGARNWTTMLLLKPA